MVAKDKSYWERYPDITLKADLATFERKCQMFRGENLKLALTTGIHNRTEYETVKKILGEREAKERKWW